MINSGVAGINIGQEFQGGPGVYGNVFPEAQFRGDCIYLRSVGYEMARMPLKQLYSGQSYIDWNRIAVRIAKEYFPYISLGSGLPHSMPCSSYGAYRDFMINDEIPYLLANGYGANDVYMIGNEIEMYMEGCPIASLQRTSNVVTVITTVPHFLATGDGINTYGGMAALGIGSTQFSNETIITVINSTTFTFANTGSNAGPFAPPAGSNTFYMSTKGAYRLIKRLAQEIKDSGCPMKLSYSCLHNVTNNGDGESNSTPPGNVQANTYAIDHFISVGRGPLDYVDLNMYSYTSLTSLEKGFRYFAHQIKKGYDAFGKDNFRVTEWNIWHNQTGKYTNTEYAMKDLALRQDFLTTLPGLKHFFFCYRWQNSEWLQVLKPHNRTIAEGAKFRDWWWQLIAERQPTVEISNNSPTRVISVRDRFDLVNDVNMGINMGQYEQSGSINVNQVSSDLTYLYNKGVRRIRTASGWSQNISAVNACRTLALMEKAKGFFVQKVFIGPHSDVDWPQYVIDCTAEAAWCVANGIDELCIGNEIEGEYGWNGPFTDIVNKLKNLATSIKATYPTLLLNYAAAQDRLETEWIATAGDIGGLDHIGYNVYGYNELFGPNFVTWSYLVDRMHNAFGSRFEIAEWSVYHIFNQFPQPESVQTAQMAQRLAYIKSLGLTHYFFTWNWPQANDQFALKKADGTVRGWYEAFFTRVPREDAEGREDSGDREDVGYPAYYGVS